MPGGHALGEDQRPGEFGGQVAQRHQLPVLLQFISLEAQILCAVEFRTLTVSQTLRLQRQLCQPQQRAVVVQLVGDNLQFTGLHQPVIHPLRNVQRQLILRHQAALLGKLRRVDGQPAPLQPAVVIHRRRVERGGAVG